MSITTVAVTGGNGKIGRAILAELNSHGYRTVNLARGKRREDVADEYRTTNLLDAGEVYGSLAHADADAVIHMGTIPRPTSYPGYVTYESNVMSPYHILEAAASLGLEAVCLASSINAMGSGYQDDPMEVYYLPVDEEHIVTPRDPYALGKHAMEITADGFGREGTIPTISSLRYPWVCTTEEMERSFVESDRQLPAEDTEWLISARNGLCTYLHIDDAARIARLSIEADFEGHEVFWAVAEDTTVDAETRDIIDRCYPTAECRADFSGVEGLVDIEKAENLLDWVPEISWRDVDSARN